LDGKPAFFINIRVLQFILHIIATKGSEVVLIYKIYGCFKMRVVKIEVFRRYIFYIKTATIEILTWNFYWGYRGYKIDHCSKFHDCMYSYSCESIVWETKFENFHFWHIALTLPQLLKIWKYWINSTNSTKIINKYQNVSKRLLVMKNIHGFNFKSQNEKSTLPLTTFDRKIGSPPNSPKTPLNLINCRKR
jgi:hypothetical protein